MPRLRLITVAALFALCANVQAAGLSTRIAELDLAVTSADREVKQASQKLSEEAPAYTALTQSDPTRGRATDRLIQQARAEIDQREREAQNSIAEAKEQLSEINSKLKLLREEGLVLEQEKKRLEDEKTEILQREQLFSMGFYTSLVASLLAGLGLLVRLPTTRLEAKLKRLDIEQRTLELQRLKSNPTPAVT